ncbi:hypothetical protein IEQ34_006081 [Dendrobium chrysotoxum]|uniref:PsbP C-terminal domain-containing protein n=1 Tax=Dendrobium chrysotoxum TaxID=161865 RepID=A0AAV7HES6_DENCH|nr:hypothetical protein IEQ34_006081 [Dendrobium chrysotoxum]
MPASQNYNHYEDPTHPTLVSKNPRKKLMQACDLIEANKNPVPCRPSCCGQTNLKLDKQATRFYRPNWLRLSLLTFPIKSVTAFYPKEVSNSNVSITIAGVGPDFTALGSFGKVDAFAETLVRKLLIPVLKLVIFVWICLLFDLICGVLEKVNGLDRSWQRPPGVAAKLISSAAANGLYYIEYTLQNPGERLRHIFSAIGIASNGWYNRLYTVTGQFMDDEEENYKSLVEKVNIDSKDMGTSPLGLEAALVFARVSTNLDFFRMICLLNVPNPLICTLK